MGLLYNIAKWSVNKLIRKGVDLSNLVETDKQTKLLREAAYSLNNELIQLQDEFCIKRAEIIKAQNELIYELEPTYITLLAESSDSMLQTTMTKLWMDRIEEINKLIEEHEQLIAIFDKKRNQLDAIESKTV